MSGTPSPDRGAPDDPIAGEPLSSSPSSPAPRPRSGTGSAPGSDYSDGSPTNPVMSEHLEEILDEDDELGNGRGAPNGQEEDEEEEELLNVAYSPGTPTTAEEPMGKSQPDSNAPTPTKDEVGHEDRLSHGSLSPVSNASMPSDNEPESKSRNSSKQNDEEAFSSLSSDDAEVLEKDLEDGEILLPKNKAAGTSSLRRSRSRSLSRSRSRSGYNSPPRKDDLPRYDVRYLINRKRGIVSHRDTGSGRRSTGYNRSRSRSLSPRRRRPRRSSSRSRSPRRASPAPRKSSYRRLSRSPPPKKKRKNLRQRSVSPVKKTKRRRQRSSSRSRSRSRSKSPKKKGKKKTAAKKITKASKKKSATTKKKAAKVSRTITRSPAPAAPSVVTEKEVFTSGDKILVSVNFKQSQQPAPTTRTVTKEKKKKKKKQKEDLNGPTNKVAVAAAQNQKPAMVIDLMASPYEVFESSPAEVINVASDEEKENNSKDSDNKEKNGNDIGMLSESDVEELVLSSPPSNNNFHKGPCTPPADDNETLDLAKGPQTPDDSIDDSYDPCDPTESPELEESMLSTNGDVTNGKSGNDNSTGAGGSSGNMSIDLASIFQSVKENASKRARQQQQQQQHQSDDMDMDLGMDLDVDSPCSPQGSDLSDLFEPPSASKRKSGKANHHRNGMKSKGKKTKSKSTVQMKLIDDKLKIIDDVPTSAVEMAVKEKFLRKVQRQERIVDEIKAILKPFYNKKKISKDSYKEIMRKCVPKVCHSKTGAINTTKIQKLVRGYVRKYKFMEKKGGGSANNSAAGLKLFK